MPSMLPQAPFVPILPEALTRASIDFELATSQVVLGLACCITRRGTITATHHH
ncbi:hypothetical protein SXCC_00173 [Gluconacetobacter sp. SXCC-1]|nr:hypothetical protein SXCC_00173 [Gluconacetobacter sp. SXCC-1]